MNNITKMKVNFTVKVDAELDLTSSEVDFIKNVKAEGKEIFKIEALKQDLAKAFGIDKECIDIVDHSEILIEGKGE